MRQRAQWAKNDADVRAILARRKERLRAYDEYLSRRSARPRRLTLAMLGR